MIYFFESEFPIKKPVYYSLLRVFGLGKFNSFLICKQLGFAQNLKFKHLSKQQINKIIQIVSHLKIKITSDLKKLSLLNKKASISLKCYKSLRKIKGLPIRGQRTHTNSRTARKFLANGSYLSYSKN